MSRAPLIAAAVVLAVVLVGAAVHALRRQQAPTVPPPELPTDAPRPTFALHAADGRPFTDADLRGRVAMVYFGFTACPDVCPTELGFMTRTLRQLGPLAEAVQPVFITIDPERDAPESLAAYVQAFHPRLLGLTGTPAEIAAAAAAFGVVYRKQTPVSQQPGFYLIDHTLTTFILDREGRLVHRLASHSTDPARAAALLRPLLGDVP